MQHFISVLTARIIPDSRGDETIEVSMRLSDGSEGIASVPQGKSTGAREVACVSARQAVKNIEEIIAPALINLDFEQEALDRQLLELDGSADKSHLGGNTILAVSVAVAKAVAASRRQALWEYLRELYGARPAAPTLHLYFNMINGGLHARDGLPFQEYIVIPETGTVYDALAFGKKFYAALRAHLFEKYGDAGVRTGDEGGFVPPCTDVTEPFELFDEVGKSLAREGRFTYGLDAAANAISKTPAELHETYKTFKDRFNFAYLEDPFKEEDFEQFSELTREIGNQVVVAGDDLTTTNKERMMKAKEQGSVNGIIIKPNQVGTVTETLEAVRFAREAGWKVVVSHRSGETMDDFIADLAWAVGADGAKFGAPLQKERMVKYERIVAIEKVVTATS